MVVDSFFRKTNNTTNRLIRSRMKPRQVGKHVVGTFKVQIQQFLQCALTMEVADERRRAETLSTLVNNSSEAMGSTQMRASAHVNAGPLHFGPPTSTCATQLPLPPHHLGDAEARKKMAGDEGRRAVHRLRGDDAAVIMGMWFRVAICLFWKRNTDN